MAKFVIDGKEFNGNSLRIAGGLVVVDGVTQEGSVMGVVEVRVTEGVLGDISSDMSIYAGDVVGNVTAGMSVECGNVGGDVTSKMSVTCGTVGGDIDAGMSVSHRGRP